MKEIQANIQLMDSYIKNYNLNLKGRLTGEEKVDLGCSITFGIVKIEKKEENQIGQIKMKFQIEIIKKEEIFGKIELEIQGLFETNKNLSKEEFEKVLKYNGAPVISNIARSYIIANTSLSEMPTIRIPLINFVEFFDKANKTNKENK